MTGDTRTKDQQPTEAGKYFWPPDGYYDGIPCTCAESCTGSCTGSCGCKACHAAYSDNLSSRNE